MFPVRCLQFLYKMIVPRIVEKKSSLKQILLLFWLIFYLSKIYNLKNERKRKRERERERDHEFS